MEVRCCQFEVRSFEETCLFHKTTSGWKSMKTTPFALSQLPSGATIDTYIRQHVVFFLDQRKGSKSWLDDVLQQAIQHASDALLQGVLNLWSAHCLLMAGWQLAVPGDLGMFPVIHQGSLLNGTTPAPRVLQNQLDRMLEQYCADKELECLSELQKSMRRQVKRPWIVVFIVTVLLLHIRERDVWRLLYWTLHNNNTYTWRHPEQANTLIKRSVHASNVLLAHLYVAGDVPDSFLFLTTHYATIPVASAKERYHWMNEDSADFSLCRLAFIRQGVSNSVQASPLDFGC
ncbi:uncharacterized protein ALTATR162_LOCUS450 [Alternaria atra]|uniref:Uncharacterized protein n=1 Tax=Alternaria atra TaxID=119953 RepID=A0A8J2HS14_9PLEO|nr:uncharacterized protein ALTATR162_LOCUS450 [Alternaria atra]CAG5138842.1 unnamed protein product [Alternaria atra]